MKDAVLIFAVFLFASALAVWAAGTHQHKEVPELPLPVHRASIPEFIVEESMRAGISAHLPLAIAWRESRMQPDRISRTSDYGLFQLHASTVRTLHVANPLDARQNTIAGVGLVARYLTLCKTERRAIHAYGVNGRCR